MFFLAGLNATVYNRLPEPIARFCACKLFPVRAIIEGPLPFMANTLTRKIMIARPGPTAESRTRFPANHREDNRSASPSRIGAFVTFVRRSKLAVGAFVLLAFLILFWFAIIERNGIQGLGVAPVAIWDAVLLVGANLIGSLIVFLIVFGLLQYLKDTHREEVLTRTVVEPLKEVLRDGHETVYAPTDRIDWATLFAGTDEVLLLGQGWDGWEERVEQSLPAFLDRGGKIRAIFPDLDEPEPVEAMARRVGREPKEVEQEIRQTISALQETIVRHLGAERARAQFSYSYTKQLTWFCGIYFKPGKLLLSLYPHQQSRNGQIESPSFLVRTDMLKGVGDWFEKEWASFSNESAAEVQRDH